MSAKAAAVLETPRLRVRALAKGDAPLLLAYYMRNRAHLDPWEPARQDGFETLAFHEAVVEDRLAAARRDRGYGFVAQVPGRDDLIAVINLSTVVRGAFQAANLGYSVDAAYEGQGYGREAIGTVVDYAFSALGLHRVMANYRPANERSGRLLRALGFTVEGYARDYLKIDGAWCDHILTARTAPED